MIASTSSLCIICTTLLLSLFSINEISIYLLAVRVTLCPAALLFKVHSYVICLCIWVITTDSQTIELKMAENSELTSLIQRGL